MPRKTLTACLLLASLATLSGCNDDPAAYKSREAMAYAQAVEFFDAHWSAQYLVEAYRNSSDDLERSDEGARYFALSESIDTVNDLDRLPLWVSREEDEQEHMLNAAVWLQFIFGWDDYMRASVARPEFDYEPTGTLDDLRQPWVSGNREVFRQLLVEAGVELPAE